MIMVAEADVLDRVFHFFAKFPSPQEVLDLHTTESESARVKHLTEKSKLSTINSEEARELEIYFRAEKYVRLAKAQALMALHGKTA